MKPVLYNKNTRPSGSCRSCVQLQVHLDFKKKTALCSQKTKGITRPAGIAFELTEKYLSAL